MTVGNQGTEASVNNLLSSLAVQLRGVCDEIRTQQTYITTLGQAGLEAIGFDAADAASVIQMMNYLGNVAGVYYGTVQQGGSGGAGAILFDFDSALSGLWAGQ